MHLTALALKKHFGRYCDSRALETVCASQNVLHLPDMRPTENIENRAENSRYFTNCVS